MLKLLIALLTFPFRLLYKLGMFFIALVGKGISLILGIIITVVGIIISMTIVGLVIGLPIMMMGLSIVLSALFG